MRIAHLTATFPPYPGGAGNTCFRIARGQAERGHEVDVFTAPAPGEAPDPGGARIHRIEPLARIGNAPLIPSLAKLTARDVIHLHYPFIFGSELTLAARLVRRAAREQALVVHYKNRLVGSGPRGLLFEAYERSVAPALIRAADRVLVLSDDHARSVAYLRRAGEREPERLVELPNGVDAEQFSPGDGAPTRWRLGIPDDAVVAAFVATLDRAHHFKRLDVAIDAIARLESTDVHLAVAGDGELRPELERRARGAGVGERVHFLGAVPHAELPDVLRAADLFVLTTEPPESFGIVLAEAMATGLPAVATDYAGVRAVVAEGETGLLVPRGDVDAAAEAIGALVAAGPEGRRRMGEAGRRRAVELWSWPRLLDRIEATYAEAIARRHERLGR